MVEFEQLNTPEPRKVAVNGRPVDGKLYALLKRLRCFKVKDIDSRDEYADVSDDREPSADLMDATVSSSVYYDIPGDEWLALRKHYVTLDIDYPAHLVESSNPGHFHLYLEVPTGVGHEDYMNLLQTLGELGIIQPGYAAVSIKRGHTDLRLPWVKKKRPPTIDASVLPF